MRAPVHRTFAVSYLPYAKDQVHCYHVLMLSLRPLFVIDTRIFGLCTARHNPSRRFSDFEADRWAFPRALSRPLGTRLRGWPFSCTLGSVRLQCFRNFRTARLPSFPHLPRAGLLPPPGVITRRSLSRSSLIFLVLHMANAQVSPPSNSSLFLLSARGDQWTEQTLSNYFPLLLRHVPRNRTLFLSITCLPDPPKAGMLSLARSYATTCKIGLVVSWRRACCPL